MVDMGSLLVAMGSMGGMGAAFAYALSVASKKFYVYEDPKIGEVASALPQANCGGCGVPGCSAFADLLVSGKADVNGCPVLSEDQLEEVSAILGVTAGKGEKMIARIMCQGGKEQSAVKGLYKGAKSCTSAHLAGGGEKLCNYSCLGYGDCVAACPFDAMYMDENGIPRVIDEKCTGCGNCVTPCPRDLVEMHPVSRKLFVLCKNKDEAVYARQVCTVACTACNLCVKNVPVEGGMKIENNLAIVNYEIFGKDAVLHTEKCATECLVYVDEHGKYQAKNPAGVSVSG